MLRQSPPKHRHDGTSPLPLGMDWSPPPRKWNGRETVWPHDPRTGWSYCVTIPSWVIRPKSRDSDPVVFYRVLVGVQSPEGITTQRGVLRRFNDFLKLFGYLKKEFPKKNLPPAPPKGLLRMKSRELLEERRCSLEEWMTKLLSDIDFSRSVAVASFLELEAAARSSFLDVNPQNSEANGSGTSTISSLEFHPNSSPSALAGSSSIASDYGSDTAYEASELGTSSVGKDNHSEVGIEDLTLDEDFSSPMEKLVKYGISNLDEGLFMGETILEQLEGFPRHKVHTRKPNNAIGNESENGNSSKQSGHARKISTESIGSDGSSLRGSEMSNSGVPNSSGDTSLDLPGGAEVSLGRAESQFSDDVQIIIPLDQRHKMNRVLMTMQRRLVTAKTDMEDLIARLNQEIAVKGYLNTRVKDLEVELETTKQKSKENLHQALLVERERVTQMQWDMEELRRKSLEMELKLKPPAQGGKLLAESTKVSAVEEENVVLLQELNATKKQLENLLKRHEELEGKSKADVKVLVREVKSLRSSQTELKQQLSRSVEEKAETQRLLLDEKQRSEDAKASRRKLLHECRSLYDRLQECNINFPRQGDDQFVMCSSTLSETLDLLATSDNKVTLLLAEVQLLAQDEKKSISKSEKEHDEDDDGTEAELRKMVCDILGDNAELRRKVNSVIRYTLRMDINGVEEANNSRVDNEVER